MPESKRHIIEIQDVMSVWDFTRNSELGLDPTKLTHGSSKKAYWKCPAGHSWLSTIANRVSGTGCTYCTGKYVLEGFNNIGATHPALAAQLKDQELTSKITSGSNTAVWWVCGLGHEWWTSPNSRTNKQKILGCPYCSNHLVLAGYNDIHTTHPELSKNLVHESDGYKVTYGSGSKVLWNCPLQHCWLSTVRDISHGNGCPKCSNSVSAPELRLLESIPEARGQRKAAPRFYPDIFVEHLNLYVEYDGGRWHIDRVEWDTNRTKILLELGYKVVRIREISPWFDLKHLPMRHENLLQLNVERLPDNSHVAGLWRIIEEWATEPLIEGINDKHYRTRQK